MEIPESRELETRLRAILGGDRRYWKFVRELDKPTSDGTVHFWQDSILRVFEKKHGVALPKQAHALRALLPPLPQSFALTVDGVPPWVRIDTLDGMAPVQGSGTAGVWRWYFRARHNAWSLTAVRGPHLDPIDAFDDSDNCFLAEDDYGDLPEEASGMPLDEARFFIVQELTRLKDSRGLGDEQ